MAAIYNLLKGHRLEGHYRKFLDLGVKDERDFLDSVTEENLTELGLTQVEKNRFLEMKKKIKRFRAPEQSAAGSVQKSMETFSILYTYPKCPTQRKSITDMDPAQNTIEDLMLRICHLERVDRSIGVCLYTVDGMPLTDDPFFNTWSLQDRHIKSGDVIYAIFTPNKNLIGTNTVPRDIETQETDTIRCHIMLKVSLLYTYSL
ncbi:uncharacterized protein LOC121813310 [Haplochromis burtoni]|uniref:uncharacterized protein LOC121813310 n=1 Tax=Haplochromis burtoni TaxID=8153 RepID=UPI001C2D8934|nr:uncharacterized protein LOC121813310 [Haplochromis burtoni]